MKTRVRQALPDLTPAAHLVATGTSDVGVSASFSKLPQTGHGGACQEPQRQEGLWTHI